jgi:hypothetical protein
MTAEFPANDSVKPEGTTPQATKESPNTPPDTPPSETHIPASIEHHSGSDNTYNEIREWWKVIVETLTFIAVVWYACIASGQLIQMNKQYPELQKSADAAKKSADTASDTLTFSERAYVHIGPIESDFRAKGNSVIRIPIENSGHIPSPQMAIDGVITRLRKGESSPFDVQPLKAGGDETQIPPGTGYYKITLDLKNWPPEEIKRILADNERVGIAGTLDYATGFGKRDQSSFCFYYVPDPAIGWTPCPIGSSPRVGVPYAR